MVGITPFSSTENVIFQWRTMEGRINDPSISIETKRMVGTSLAPALTRKCFTRYNGVGECMQEICCSGEEKSVDNDLARTRAYAQVLRSYTHPTCVQGPTQSAHTPGLRVQEDDTC